MLQNEIQIFNSSEFGEIRTITIDNEPWFVSKDIAKSLGYKNTNQSVKDNTDEEDRGVSPIMTPSGIQNMVIVNESGLYALIFGSKLESAKKFKKWVTSEVLPSIRKTGEYKRDSTGDVQGQIKLLAQGTTELYERMDGLESRFAKFEQELPMLPDDADEVRDSLNKMVVFLLGGKESNAYRDRSLSKKAFMDAYRVLKYNFNVSRYKAIKRNQKAQALQIISEYKPPLFLKEQIENVNAQQSLGL